MHMRLRDLAVMLPVWGLFGCGGADSITAEETSIQAPAAPSPVAVAVGDFNHDGSPDVATANADNTVGIRLNHGNGTFGTERTFAVGQAPAGIAVGDFNRDGHLDVVAANQNSSSVSLLRGDGHGGLLLVSTTAVGQQPNAIAVGDFNHDGALDVVTANVGSNDVSLLLGKGDGTFHAAFSVAIDAFYPLYVAVADLDRDGHLDLVTSNQELRSGPGGGLSVLLGKGDGTFRAASHYATNPKHTFNGAVRIADINGDGKPDLVTSIDFKSHAGQMLVFSGNGDGTFRGPASFPAAANSDLNLADVNGDHRIDVITTHLLPDRKTGNGVLGVLLNTGQGKLGTERTYFTPPGPNALTAADLNHDGKIDLAAAGNQLGVSLGEGNGSFPTFTLY